MELDFEWCYRAVASRDSRFDGWFVTAVTSTGIYCRPSCPARTPLRGNVRFLRSAAAAHEAGFRACRRCRPDAVPGSPEWDVRTDVTGRAMRLIGDGVVDREGVGGLARHLGYTVRHLHRLLVEEVGAGPLALARAQRAQAARTLIESTDLPLGEVAFAAGFGSLRQFNDTVRHVYGVPPSALRRGHRARPHTEAGTITLRLAYRPPLHADALLDFLDLRAIPGLEHRAGDTYHRALRLPHGPAQVALTPGNEYVTARLRLSHMRDLAPAVARCRWLLDLDADPVAVDTTLAADPALAPQVTADPGVRAPRAGDSLEVAVRAVVGQQVSVAAARTVVGSLIAATRIASRTATTTDLAPFPAPADLLDLPDAAFAMPARRRETIRAVAEALAKGTLDLSPGADRDEATARLREISGVGPWTIAYLALRAFGDPDVLLATDLGVRRGAAALGIAPPALATHAATYWAPWRSYAMIRLWRQ